MNGAVDRFLESPRGHQRGDVAERAALDWLQGRGYVLVARNVRTPFGELDAVALDGDTLCFLEIKARAAGPEFGSAVEAVGPHQMRRLLRAARCYLGREPWEGPCRFDVLGLDAEPGGFRFTLLQDAFQDES